MKIINLVAADFFVSVLEEHDESSRMPVCTWGCALSFGRCRMSKFFLASSTIARAMFTFDAIESRRRVSGIPWSLVLPPPLPSSHTTVSSNACASSPAPAVTMLPWWVALHDDPTAGDATIVLLM